MTPEDAELCARLRAPYKRGESMRSEAAARIEALAVECDAIYRFARLSGLLAIDIQNAVDAARAALTEFDRTAQEKQT